MCVLLFKLISLFNLSKVPIATQKDVDEAVTAAEKAFKTWGRTPIEKRKEYMLNFVKLYATYEKQFSDLLCTETGKTRFFGTNEVTGTGKVMTFHANLTLPIEKIEEADKVITTRYVPLGVVGAISPWNFPLSTSAGKVAGALIAGCTVIVKPSPFTPYSALKFVELCQEVFPPGVVQILGGGPGAQDVGPLLVEHPGIAKISFTGSIPTGKKIMAGCAKTLKRITLELGGNDPCIVFPDVDIDKVVPEVTIGSFWNTAQVCIATKRVYIHESIYREFVDKMAAFVKNMKVGSSDEQGVMVGPMQNEMQYEKVKDFFADSKKNGYKFLGDDVVAASKGFFIQPTIIDNPPNDSRIIQEEPFGPILPVQPWSDLEEVIDRANSTNFGLGASLWTKDIAKGEEVAQRLHAGNVFVNSWTKPSYNAFFSGHKESGIGGEWGSTGLLAFCNCQVTHVFK
jgi:acyl-CoA reductase-like NAD-dependent aldehyde dehydrogenase